MVNEPGVMDIEEMQAKIKEFEKTMSVMCDTDELLLERITLVEQRLDSLSRTLDLLQEVVGIEIVITPRQETHEGQCEKCDRVGPLNNGNICEGCFYEEIGINEYPRL